MTSLIYWKATEDRGYANAITINDWVIQRRLYRQLSEDGSYIGIFLQQSQWLRVNNIRCQVNKGKWAVRLNGWMFLWDLIQNRNIVYFNISICFRALQSKIFKPETQVKKFIK